jgi:hypothetical protein
MFVTNIREGTEEKADTVKKYFASLLIDGDTGVRRPSPVRNSCGGGGGFHNLDDTPVQFLEEAYNPSVTHECHAERRWSDMHMY